MPYLEIVPKSINIFLKTLSNRIYLTFIHIYSDGIITDTAIRSQSVAGSNDNGSVRYISQI